MVQVDEAHTSPSDTACSSFFTKSRNVITLSASSLHFGRMDAAMEGRKLCEGNGCLCFSATVSCRYGSVPERIEDIWPASSESLIDQTAFRSRTWGD